MKHPAATIFAINAAEGMILWAVLFVFGPALTLWSTGAGTYSVMGVWALYEVLTFRPKVKAMAGTRPIGEEPMIGLIGKALTPLTPEGRIEVRGENWRAHSGEEHIPEGQQVKVTGRNGGILEVCGEEGVD